MLEWIRSISPAREVLESKLYLIPLFPLLGFLLNGLFGRRFSKSFSGAVGTLAAVAAFSWSLLCVCANREMEGGHAALHGSYGKCLANSDSIVRTRLCTPVILS